MKRSPLISTLLCVLSMASMALMMPLSSFDKSGGASPSPQKQVEAPMTTDERLQALGWWPTKQTASLDDFAGPKECARCHPKIAATQIDTRMAHTASLAADSSVLREHERLFRQAGRYSFAISKEEAARNYTVGDGSNTISETLGWAFGSGNKGQTYVYQNKGVFYESRMSFFSSLQGLDVTPGQSSEMPKNVHEAIGRLIDPDTLRRCFGCHTTASTTRAGFNPSRLVLGVDCEACHGPGARHAELMDAEKNAEGRQAIFNPRDLGPVAQVDFCGACHRTLNDVPKTGITGVENVRFQPYRLEKSRCWGDGDARLTCTACHDAHKPLNHDPGAYDEKCLACHASSRSQQPSRGHAGKACPVEAKNCVTCHMPKVQLPSMHASFVDHHIRIVRAKSTYPD